MLECRYRVHLFKHVDLFKQTFQNFQALSESKRYEIRNNACEKQWVGYVQFSDLPVRMSNKIIKDNHFVNFERLKTTDNVANTKCFTE